MPEVCVVVPCFNEEHRLRGDEFLSFVTSHPAASLCFVDDGSRDGTVTVLERLRARCPDRILVHQMPTNRGKAEAVRAGILRLAAEHRWPIVGYFDAGSLPWSSQWSPW